MKSWNSVHWKLVVTGVSVLAAFGTVAFVTRRPPVELRLLRVQDADGLQDLYPNWYDFPVPCRVAILELRNAGPGLLFFAPKERVLVREQMSRCVSPENHAKYHWLLPSIRFPIALPNERSMNLEGRSCQDYDFLIFIPPGIKALPLAVEYERYGLLDRAHIVASSYPWLDRSVVLPVLRVYLGQFGRKRQAIKTEIRLPAAADDINRPLSGITSRVSQRQEFRLTASRASVARLGCAFRCAEV